LNTVISFFLIFALGCWALFLYMVYVETGRFRINREAFLTPSDPGRTFKVLHISDFHFRTGDDKKRNFIRGLQKTQFDFVFVTGDIIDDDSGIPYCVEALKGFRPEFGTYVVLGGHDYQGFSFLKSYVFLLFGYQGSHTRNDSDALGRRLDKIGVRVLRNRGIDVEYQDETGARRVMQIAGVDDVFVGRDDLDLATRDFRPGTFKVLLTHCIDDPKALASRRFNAVFGGHSHGGQVRFPLLGALVTRSNLARKYARGIFQLGKTLFHINNGLGAGRWTDFRLLCPPEATILEMRGA